MRTLLANYSVQTWVSALTGATIVGLVGVLPLFIFPNEQSKKDKPYLELLLSVAVGSQLADVFLHLLPEAFSHPHASSTYIGLWTLIGLFIFFIIEQIFSQVHYNQNLNYKSCKITHRKSKTTGYLNLLANFIDNLTHGAAIGGSFAVSPLIGVTTLVGIIIHEIPHEIGDFAILLQSGFDRCQATKAQFITGLGGILGASMALCYSNFLHSTLWVLPFTSGAFLYVALVKTVPDLLKENDLKHSFRQLIGVLGGLLSIYFIVIYVG
ncbi:unnamed protein product [Rotaria magnacalcarata]|uniref:Zinc transporter ZIP13 n=1 Tax=Rotaria magnacalcarata TaxID=392030 RepID=A0A815GTV9_9BILA|nr:unnamed protein product [Rotaria magnacalcarata]CAF1342707.1 unnamed protein product [Rotaria magnacalcarata]CAF1951730.1 unnamed protein product [Rotaria magnacalcarata]CAF2049186.1 unnamed protein product [Rotaria magnacalcarata]CAF2114566.1 unnamed protein product [Rotaria magnacalcarata]